MEDEFYTKLGIYSPNLTPDQINTILGMKSDKSYLTGEIIKPSIIRHKTNGWIIYSRLSRNIPLEEHVKDLIKRVTPIVEMIKQLVERPDIEVEFGCIIYTSDRPAIFFTKEQIATISSMGASIDIDLYLLPEKDENTQ
jgi:hypothetical protein